MLASPSVEIARTKGCGVGPVSSAAPASTRRETPPFSSVGRGFLYVLALGLPFHALIVHFGIPAAWKEVCIVAAAAVAVLVPARAPRSRTNLLFAAFIALVLLSAAIHPTSWEDLRPYLAYTPLAFAIPRLISTSEQLRRMLVCAGAATAVSAILFLLVTRGIAPDLLLDQVIAPGERPPSLAGPNVVSALLFVTAAVATWFYAHRVTPTVLFLVAAAATGARTPLLGLSAALLLFMAMRVRKHLLWGWLTLVVLTGVLLLPVALWSDDDSTRQQRWTHTLQTAQTHPLVGAGPGFTSQSRLIRELGLVDEAAVGYLPDNVIGARANESSVLKIAAEVGPAALAFLALWLALVIRGAVRRGGANLVGVVVTLAGAVTGLAVSTMDAALGGVLFWFGVGLCRLRLDPTSAPGTELDSSLAIAPPRGSARGFTPSVSGSRESPD